MLSTGNPTLKRDDIPAKELKLVFYLCRFGKNEAYLTTIIIND